MGRNLKHVLKLQKCGWCNENNTFTTVCLSLHTITWLFLSWRQWGARGGTVTEALEEPCLNCEARYRCCALSDRVCFFSRFPCWFTLCVDYRSVTARSPAWESRKRKLFKTNWCLFGKHNSQRKTHSENLRCSNFIWRKWWLWGLLVWAGYILIFWLLK